MNPCDIAIEKLVPHGGNMVLIDQLIEATDETAVAIVKVENRGLFSGPQTQVPAYVGIEYMAQTIAAWAGYHALCQQEKVKLGFLLGTRKYIANVASFNNAEELRIEIKLILQGDNGLAAFECKITADNILVEANLNVFQSDDESLSQKDSI